MLGNFVDNLSVFLVAIALNLFVVGMPPEIVFGRMLPGMVIGLLAANLHLRWLAVRVARQTGRDDITALPFGVSIVFVIVYTFGLILPIKIMTGDPELAWKVAVVATVIGGIIEYIGAAVGPRLQKFLPRAVMLGALGGIGVVFIAGLSLADVFSNPFVGFPAMAVLFWAYIGRGKMPFRLPAGLIALILGAILALILPGQQTKIDFSGVGFQLPQPWVLFLGGQAWSTALQFLGIIIPIAIIDFIVTIDNVESANSVKDPYPVLEPMLLDGTYTIVGAIFGSPYPNTTFIGHPAYKRMGARVNYGTMAAIILFILVLFGLFSGISNLIPIAAVAPILVFIGLTMTDVSFQETPRNHYIAVAAAFVPYVVEFGKEKVDQVASALGVIGPLSPDQLQAVIAAGSNYPGYAPLAYGTVLISMIFAALVAFMVSQEFMKAALVGVVAAILAFFGVIHAPQMGIAAAPELSAMWLLLAIGFVIVHQFRNQVVEQPSEAGTPASTSTSEPVLASGKD
jgi:AGZA family xanthine/uracil permease-like MFS transporter